jgi:hypothetical protein
LIEIGEMAKPEAVVFEQVAETRGVTYKRPIHMRIREVTEPPISIFRSIEEYLGLSRACEITELTNK